MKKIFTKIKLSCLLLTCALWFSHLQGDAQTLQWVKTLGGNDLDQCTSSVLDAAGNLYVTGIFTGTVDFDPGSGTAMLTASTGWYNHSMYIAKYDANGNYIWAKSMNSIGSNQGIFGTSLALDAAGNVYMTGYFAGTIDFDPGAGTATLTSGSSFGTYYFDVFVSKYDANGDYVWAKSMQGTGSELGYDIGLDATGDIYITGQFLETMDFDPGPGTASLTAAAVNGSIFLAKYDASGNYLWAIQFGAYGTNSCKSLALDAAGNVFVTGSFYYSSDFDPGAGTATLTALGGSSDIFLAKYDPNGNYVWAKSMGSSSNYDFGNDLALDATGNIYLIGTYSDTIDMDPGPGIFKLTSLGAYTSAAFLAKYDGSGNYIWAVGLAGNVLNTGNSAGKLAVDDLGNIYMTGNFTGTVDFDPGPAAVTLTSGPYTNSTNMFLAKYTGNGGYLWAKTTGFNQFVGGMALGAGGDMYLTGSFQGTMDFDLGTATVNRTATGGQDGFILKTNQPPCNTFSSVIATACDSYTFNGQTYTATGPYTQTYTNIAGCDSIVTLALTINHNDSTLNYTVCDSLTYNGTTYTATGIYQDTFTNVAGCDSVVTVNLTVNHTTINPTVTGSYCDSVTFNNVTYNASGTYTQYYTNFAGCDSNLTYDITINTTSGSSLTLTACDSFVFDAANVFTFTGVYTIMLTNQGGCDSIITLDLTINNAPQASIIQNGSTLTASSADQYQWIDCSGNDAIPGATEQIYTATQNGSYAVVVASNNCSDTSDCVLVDNLTGINGPGNGIGGSIKLYPNPADGDVTIKTDKLLNNATIRLINSMGQTLTEQTGQHGISFSLNIERHTAGVYFVEISEGGRKTRLKLVKK